MAARLTRRLVMPAVIFIGVAIVVGIMIVVIGELLLGLHDPHATAELKRPELYVALALALAVLAGSALLATRPRGSLGLLDEEIAVGRRPFFAPEPAGIDPNVRRGPLGTIADIKEGDTLYARSGPLARVIALLPGEEEYGRRRRGLIYASGLFGANDELWIPVEAVFAVYPETGAVFLAAKGDETEHFGWNLPPESFRRGARRHSPPSSF